MAVPPKKKRPCTQCKTRMVVPPALKCATCKRLNRQAASKAHHEKYVMETYGISAGDYDRLYASQNGKCYICEKATGKTRRLAVDHDHKTGEVRGLLCKFCNYRLLGMFAKDSIVPLQRAIEYLQNPPARKVLNRGKDGGKG